MTPTSDSSCARARAPPWGSASRRCSGALRPTGSPTASPPPRTRHAAPRDAGGPLVVGAAERCALGERLVRGDARDRDRARVRHVRQQRTEGHDDLDAERLGQVDDRGGERAPAHRRLRTGEEHQVTGRAGDVRREDLHLGPGDLARDPVAQRDLRARRLEVVELLRIDRREAFRAERRGHEAERGRGGVGGVVPAAERAYEGRRTEALRPAIPDERLHPIHRTSWAREPRRSVGAPRAGRYWLRSRRWVASARA